MVTAILLAGCADCEAPFTAFDVADDAPAEGGNGPRTVRLTVQDDDGLSAASALFWWAQDASQREVNGTLILAVMGLRSEDGTFTAEVPADRDIHLTVASDREHTEEWLSPAYFVGGSDEATVRLYNASVHATIQGTWGGASVATQEYLGSTYGSVEWQPTVIPFHADPDINRGYHDRLTEVTGQLSWTNSLDGTASLGVLAQHETEAVSCYYQNDDRDLAPGSYTQRFQLPFDYSDCFFGFPLTYSHEVGDPPVRIGPATGSHVVAPLQPLPYTLELEGEFQARAALYELCEAYSGRDITLVHIDPESGEAVATGAPSGGARPRQTTPSIGIEALVGLLVLVTFLRRREGS